MLRRITKSLFCRKDVCGNSAVVIDGVIVNSPDPVLQTSPDELPVVLVKKEERETISVESKTVIVSEAGVKAEPSPLPLSGIPKQYLVHLSAAGRAHGTIQEYSWDLKWWQRQAGALPEINIQTIETTIKDMHPCTAQRKIASLRSYAKWLLREGEDSLHGQLAQVMLPKTPGRIPRDRGTKAFKELSARAIELTTQGDRRGIWLGLMLCCGLRISEIQTTQVTPGKTIKVKGKGNKERLLPAPDWLRSALRKNRAAAINGEEPGILSGKNLKKWALPTPIACVIPLPVNWLDKDSLLSKYNGFLAMHKLKQV